MESVLYDIEELQKLARELAESEAMSSRDSYADECWYFLERIEDFVVGNNLENVDFLWAKLAEVRANIKRLLRQDMDMADPLRYQALVNNGLNAVYMNIKSPVTAPAAENDA